MAIVIKEYLGSNIGNKESSFTPLGLAESIKTNNVISRDSLMVDIEGIHVGPTRNYTWYTEQALKGSVPSWTNPYKRPLILHHNEKNGEIIGRVLSAKYTDNNTRSKTGALVFTCNVSDSAAKQGVKDGRLETTSIGVIAHDVRCSICGHVISEYGECEHERGMKYDDEICYWMIYEMEAKELSYVIVPSDIYAHNLKFYSPEEKSFVEHLENKGVIELAEANKELNENLEPTMQEEKVEIKKAETEKVEEKTEVTDKPKNTDTEDVEALKATIEKLEGVIEDLKDRVKKAESKAATADMFREAAEQELVTLNKQIKEFAVDQVIFLRGQLGKSVMTKENLMKRTQESLMDSIMDLTEEINPQVKKVNITESVEKTEEPKEEKKIEEVKNETINLTESVEEAKKEVKEDVSKIEIPVSEALVDNEKDTSVKKEDKEKKSELDVKESLESSNISYETTLRFYNL